MSIKTKKKLGGLLFYTVLTLAVLVVIFPIYYLFVLSLQPVSVMYDPAINIFPTMNPFKAYWNLLTTSEVWRWVVNTVLVALVTIPGCIILAIPAAYGLSRFRFKGKAPAMFAILLTQMLPSMFLLVPIYIIVSRMGLGNTLWGVMLVDVTFVLPVAVWFLKGFCDGIPSGIEEAAIIDGCTRFGVMIRIALPMLLPGIAAAATWSLISLWNEYLFAFTLLSDSKLYTVSIGLSSQITLFGTDFTILFGGAFVATLPILIIFMFFQKYLVSGLTAGAVKE